MEYPAEGLARGILRAGWPEMFGNLVVWIYSELVVRARGIGTPCGFTFLTRIG